MTIDDRQKVQKDSKRYNFYKNIPKVRKKYFPKVYFTIKMIYGKIFLGKMRRFMSKIV